MASYSEIQKLEQRHRENPDGRTFAPLADAYRRAGRLEEAHQLVQAGLLKHPEYVSAHIVLGRCLIDLGDAAGARLAFEQVYALDSENIIALRTLSELAEAGSRFADADYWLRQALDVDPMNPDIRDALERVAGELQSGPEPAAGDDLEFGALPEPAADEISAESAPLALDEEPTVEPASPEAATIDDELAEFEAALAEPERPEPESPAPEPPQPEVDDFVIERGAATEVEGIATPPEIELDVAGAAGDDWRDDVVEDVADTPGIEPASPVADVEIERASEEVAPKGSQPWMPVGIDAGSIVPFDGRIDFSQVESEAAPPLDIEPDEPALEVDEADVAPIEGLASTQFESMELAGASGGVSEFDIGEAPPAEEPSGEVDEAVEPRLGAPFPDPDDGRERADSALADLPVFIPEEDDDLAELEAAVEEDYHAADHDALEEAEPVVTETMAELLVAQGHLEEAIRVYRALLAAKPGDPLLERRLAALEGRPAPATGQTVGQLFRGLIAAEPNLSDAPAPLQPPPSAMSEPAPAAGDGGERTAVETSGRPSNPLSLDEVFGGAESGASEVLAPAEPPASDPEPAARPQDPDEFSFDAFFGGETAPPETIVEAEGDSESDLDEFQAWLRGLKS